MRQLKLVRQSGLRRGVPTDIAAEFVRPQRPHGEDGDGVALPMHVPIYLPEVYPIPDAVEFNPSGSKSTVAVETGIMIPLAPALGNGAVELPDQNVGIIRGFSITVTDMLPTTDITYTLLVGGAPAGGYGALKIIPRAATFVGNNFDCFIRVAAGASIAVMYTNTDGGSYVVGASVSGWYWPVSSGKRWLEKGM